MPTSPPTDIASLPHVTTESFGGEPFPAETAAQILNMLIGGSPFCDSVTRYPTANSGVAFPVASPDRPGWVPELGTIPIANLNDDAYLASTVKLATIVLLSNESVSDAAINLSAELQTLLRDSASAELDRGCLYGQGAGEHEPVGVVAAAQAAAGADLAAAITEAIGSIGDAGGAVDRLAARPSVLAGARNLRDAAGVQLYPDGIGAAFGVEEVGVPELQAGDILAYDSTRVALIVRDDFGVDVSQDFAFRNDAAAIRIRGRFAIAVPVVAKSLRRLQVSGGTGTQGASPQAATAKAPAQRAAKSA